VSVQFRAMKRLACLVVLLAIAAPAWAKDKMSVSQLEVRLQSMHEAGATDNDVAKQLIEIELTESLSAGNIRSMQSLLPGQESRDWLSFLAAQSAVLPPASSEIPATPAPDLATQQAILARCVDYVTKVYMHNPHLVATKTTNHYDISIIESGRRDMNTTLCRTKPSTTTTYTYPTVQVEIENGIETAVQQTPKKTYLVESRISTGPALSLILQQAVQGGHLAWERWQLIHGKPVAVFSFAVDKNISQYKVDYCCFWGQGSLRGEPELASYYDFSYQPFKQTVPFHGAFFIDPETGTVVRLILQAELSPAAPVHREDTRIDYDSVKVNDASVTVPVAMYILGAVVPNAENPHGYRENPTISETAYSKYRIVNKQP
jgi:hypothetical protein